VKTLHRGRVLRDDGSPVPGALVAVASGTAPTPEIAIRCDDDGRFRIALPSGRFRIEARAPDGAVGTVDATTDQQAIEIEIIVKSGP
jgi:hypothetical protein